MFLFQVFRKPDSRKMIRRQVIEEIDRLILSSIVIVGVISLFMGGVLVIQTASNMSNPILDKMLIGYMVRESMNFGVQLDDGGIDSGGQDGLQHCL